MGVLVFVGCFLVLFGHRAFGLTQAIFGVYLVSMVAYPVSVGVFSAQHALALVASAGAGLLGNEKLSNSKCTTNSISTY